MTEFTNYKFESDGETVTVVHEANFVRRTIFEHDLTSLLKNKKLVESDKDLKKTYILKRSKKVLQVGEHILNMLMVKHNMKIALGKTT